MSAEARYFRVGLFVLTGVVLIGGCTVILGGQQLFQESVLFETYFDESVQGLEVGSPVKVLGVKIGTVSEVGLLPSYYPLDLEKRIEHGQKVVVRMELTGPQGEGPDPESIRNLERMIDRGLRLRLTTQGLTGTSYLEAAYLSPENFPPMEIVWSPAHHYVPSAPSTMSKISSAAERIASRLEDIDIGKVVGDLDHLILTVTAAVDELEVAEVRSAATALITDLRATLEGAEIDATGRDLRESLEKITAILTRVQRVVDSGQYDVEVSLENLRVASENLRDLTDTARSYPSLLLLGEPPKPPSVGAQ
jgi:phospholipid/cholesterol/gamma-HCH transport system substrate-binding protein/paraquat-inducible protein B